MCVQLHAHTYCIHVLVHKHTCAYMFMNKISAYIDVYGCLLVHVNLHVRVKYACICTCTYIYKYTCTCMYICTCRYTMCICTYMYKCLHVHIFYKAMVAAKLHLFATCCYWLQSYARALQLVSIPQEICY